MTLQIAFSIIFNKNITSIWMLVNALQFIHFSALLSLYFPLYVTVLFNYLSISNFDVEIFADLYLLHIGKSRNQHRSLTDYRYSASNISSSNILIN